jgi:ATP synthase protein I
MSEKKSGHKEDPGAKGNLLWASSLGINLVLASAAGITLGWFLDKWFKTAPVLVILFFFIGTFAGFRQIYMAIKKLEKDDKNNEQG